MDRSIIIIGAGAAGLQAGRRLSAAGFSVIILEAGAEPGGRILSLSAGGVSGFSVLVEGGAEFIHGELPLSLELAREAGAELEPVSAQMVRIQAGKKAEDFMSGDWDELYKQMGMLTEDMPFADFLSNYFPGDRYAALRNSAGRMAEGYDLADLTKASTLSLYREWSAEEDDEVEYRPVGGYRRLIDFLVGQCERQGCVVHYSAVVNSVRWEHGGVVVETADGQVYSAARLLSTVSLGVLKSGAIRFMPELPADKVLSIERLGYGSVIKILLEFDQVFWRGKKKPGRTLFMISEEPVPTWWTQSADDCPVITGWVSGERMRVLRALDKEGRIDSALRSLAAIFAGDAGLGADGGQASDEGPMDVAALRGRLRASLVLDWEMAAAVRGGYSYDTVGAPRERKILGEPVDGTLFFAGEGLYEGDVPGTVEAAFCSGVMVADKIIAQS